MILLKTKQGIEQNKGSHKDTLTGAHRRNEMREGCLACRPGFTSFSTLMSYGLPPWAAVEGRAFGSGPKVSGPKAGTPHVRQDVVCFVHAGPGGIHCCGHEDTHSPEGAYLVVGEWLGRGQGPLTEEVSPKD